MSARHTWLARLRPQPERPAPASVDAPLIGATDMAGLAAQAALLATLPVRAVVRQSMSRMSSPALYGRDSSKSSPRPSQRDAQSPA